MHFQGHASAGSLKRRRLGPDQPTNEPGPISIPPSWPRWGRSSSRTRTWARTGESIWQRRFRFKNFKSRFGFKIVAQNWKNWTRRKTTEIFVLNVCSENTNLRGSITVRSRRVPKKGIIQYHSMFYNRHMIRKYHCTADLFQTIAVRLTSYLFLLH